MANEALIRAILERVQKGETEIDTTPKTGDNLDPASAQEFKETMHLLHDRNLIDVKHKHLGGKWEIAGLTNEGVAYLKSMDEV